MSAVDAFGTQWAFSTDGTVFTDVGEVTNVGVLDVKVDTIDTSSHDSTDQWRTFVGGMKDGGELKMDVNYDPALHGAIFAQIGADGISHKITLPDAGGATVEFDGIITGFGAQAPYDDKLAASITIKVSGAPVITP